MQQLRRCGIVLFFAALVSGCSSINLWEPDPLPTTAQTNECRRNQSQCMYNGPYEPGEKQYAEEEARRLNQASLERLRRSSIR